MKPMSVPDELNEYLQGDSALSRAYRRESHELPPPVLDRVVLEAARGADPKAQCLRPMAFAACVLLSFAMVLAVVLAPAPKPAPEPPHVMRVRLYSEANTARKPAEWLAEITALRRQGRIQQAAQEMRRFRLAYPSYVVPSEE
jgi:hypothetical protein